MSVGSVARRSGWIFLALLFVVTGLGAGVYGFWQFTHQPEEKVPEQTSQQTTSQDQKSTDTSKTATDSSTNKPGKLEGAMLDGFTPIDKISVLKVEDKKVGSGAEAKSGGTVTAHYTGAVASTGKIFQSSLDTGQPFTSPLSNLIKGWQQGIPGMKEGGERRLLIPASLAYGSNPPPGIPANADLVFDIVLISVK